MTHHTCLSLAALLLATATALGAPLPDLRQPDQCRIAAMGSSSHFRLQDGRLDLRLDAGKDRWQGVIVRPPDGQHFDLSAGSVVAVTVHNRNRFPMTLNLEIVNLVSPDNPNGFSHIAPGAVALLPGETAPLRVRFGRAVHLVPWAPQGMQHLFDGFDRNVNCKYNIKPSRVAQLRIWSTAGKDSLECSLSDFRLEDPPAPLSPALASEQTFYPFIDRFGQYRHAEWPGKLHDEAELAVRRRQEDADLDAHPDIPGRNRFGGWADGPTFPHPNGAWGTVKHRGKWFLTDPEGKLFWSLGMNSIELDACDPTGISLRERYFQELPPQTPENAVCFPTSPFPRYGFYKNKPASIRRLNFHRHNLILKYGASRHWEEFLVRSQRRLRSWGFNTNGNWLAQQVLQHDHLPYISAIFFPYQVIEGCRLVGWQKFPDVFSPSYADGLAKALRGPFASSAKDPFCIGYFVDNELSWGMGDTFLAEGALRSPASQPAKRALVAHLRTRHASIAALNGAWGTDYASFDDLLTRTDPPADSQRARRDLADFNDAIVNRYFRTIRDVIRREAPGKLYFGCRFNDWNVKVIRTSAKYLDACSFNLYKTEVARWSLPDGVDLPVVIGEWHFGTANSGPAHPGLQATASQRDRARAFDRYVRSALWNPLIVGAHYFKYCDQATTGRPPDDENIQCGFIDVTDTPYPAMVEAARAVSRDLYRYRLSENAAP